MRSTDNLEPLEGLPPGTEEVMAVFEAAGLLPLLRPMDLSKNFDTDMGKYLENYLEFLRMYDAESTNFPIAATILQNTSTVYSKKVDFVYAATTQLLDVLRSKVSEKTKKPNTEHNEEESEEEVEEQNRENMARKVKENKKTITTKRWADDPFALDDIMTDKCLDVFDFEEEMANQKEFNYIPNTVFKLKPKPGTSIDIYANQHEILGQKHDYRLWRYLTNGGVLEIEFNYDSEEEEDYPEQLDDDSSFEMPHINDTLNELRNEVMCNGTHHEDNINEINEHEEREPECREPTNRPEEHLVNEGDINCWLERAAPVNCPETPINQKKTKKLPEELQDEIRKSKRKWNEFKRIVNKYDVLSFVQVDGSIESDLLEINPGASESRQTKHHKLQRKRRYNEMLVKEAQQDFEGDFLGFSDDSDEENGFCGFVDINDDNDVDIPVPSPDILIQNSVNPQEGGATTYEDEAQRVLGDLRKQRLLHDKQQMTETNKKVADWHQLILPLIEKAEDRAHFDVHEFGSKVLDKFPKSDGKFTLSFEKIMENENREDAARYLLSTLMLATTHNIEISKSDPSDLAEDCMNVTLLSRVRHHDELDDSIRATFSKN